MKSAVASETLKLSWNTAGFSTFEKKYAFKLLVQNGVLTTLLTDYRTIYLEEVILSKKFAKLNAKLSGPDDVLISKVHELMRLESSKQSMDVNRQKGVLTVDFENKLGKRLIRWRFDGKELSDNGNTFYLQIVRPLLDIISFAAASRRLDFSKEMPKITTLGDPFQAVEVQELYKSIVARPEYQTIADQNEEEDEEDDGLVENYEEVMSRKKKEELQNEDQKSESGSLRSTPPPVADASATPPPEQTSCSNEEDGSQSVASRKRGAARKFKRGKALKKEKHVTSSESDDSESLSPTPPPVETHKQHLQTPQKPMKEDSDDNEKSSPLQTPPKTPKRISPKKPRLKF